MYLFEKQTFPTSEEAVISYKNFLILQKLKVDNYNINKFLIVMKEKMNEARLII